MFATSICTLISLAHIINNPMHFFSFYKICRVTSAYLKKLFYNTSASSFNSYLSFLEGLAYSRPSKLRVICVAVSFGACSTLQEHESSFSNSIPFSSSLTHTSIFFLFSIIYSLHGLFPSFPLYFSPFFDLSKCMTSLFRRSNKRTDRQAGS